MPEPLPETTLAWLRQSAAVDGAAYSQVLLRLLERVEALEQRPAPPVELATPISEAAPVATDNGLLRCYGLAIADAVKRAASCDEAKEAGRRAIYNLGRQHGAAQPAPEPAPVVTDGQILAMRSWSSHGPTFDSDLVEFGRNCYDLGREHDAAQPPTAQPAPPPAPAGGLVERVVVAGGIGLDENGRAAIREVAYFLGDLGYRAAKADLLEQAANA
jgi:hypothetical protein